MHLHISDPLSLSADEALKLIRDEMPTLTPYLNGTESITVLERSDDGDETKIVNRWQASGEQAPKALRPFLKPELLSWLDHANWSAAERCARWRLEPTFGAALFRCSGVTTIHPRGEQSTLSIEVDFEVYPERLPGVPKLLARGIRGQVERFIGELLTESLRELSQSVERYVAER